MHFQAAIVVARTNEQVWSFFNEPSNLVKWDRSVAQVMLTSAEPFGVGSTFDTIAPVTKARARQEGFRTSYCITKYVPNSQMHMRNTSSRLFSFAEWIMTTEAVSDGVRILSQFEGTLRLRYSFLLPVFLLLYQAAFRRDLTYLKQAIEQNEHAG